MIRRPFVAFCYLALVSLLLQAEVSSAAPPQARPKDKQSKDARLGRLKDLNGYFPFAPSKTPEAWQKRARQVRRQVLLANGLWPMPKETPLRPVIHGAVDRGDYTVEKVFFESIPGFYVTGNLYRPKGKSGRLPAVLCPHGHWANGRFHDHGESTLKRELKSGAEKFKAGGRHPLQARCVTLARLGCIVFHYDMIGYADSVQLSYQLTHRFSKQRPSLSTPDRWGLFSAQAESRLIGLCGLQTYNSKRALDWLVSRGDVDPKRIAVTGGSGGGTQTFMLAAIDPRVAVAFPAVMVSTAMQGGCTCENCTYLRVGTGNIELAALFAPKPLALSAANDWTKELETKGLPELKQLYKTLGVADLVNGKHFDFGHNYNYRSRAMMYEWMNRHLKLGHRSPISERDFVPLSVSEMSVWNDKYPKPTGGEAFEVKLMQEINTASNKQIAALTPTDAKSLARYRETIGGALDAMIGRRLSSVGKVEAERTFKKDRGDYFEFAHLVRSKTHGEEVPVIFLMPKKGGKRVVVWVDRKGKAGLYAADGSIRPEVKKLMAAGVTVAGLDLLYQGESSLDGKPLKQARRVSNRREALSYTLGYNPPLFVHRVHDILTLLAYITSHKEKPERIDLVGLNGAGHWVAAACAQAGDAADGAAIDTAGFRFAKLTGIRDLDLLPGAVKYGDLPAILALAAPTRLWLAGEGKTPPAVTKKVYRAKSGADAISSYTGPQKEAAAAAVNWLLER